MDRASRAGDDCARRPLRAFLSVLAALLLAAPAVAAVEHTAEKLMELSVEELLGVNVEEVSAASTHQQPVGQAPAAVSIIDRDEIRRYGYRTLVEILESVPGFFASYDRNYHTLGVRGFLRPADFNTRILLLVDGHRLNDNLFSGAAVGTDFLLDVDLIDRVEVVRGPASALYGTNAVFGVVNVITRSARDLSREVAVSGGSLGTWEARASVGHELSDRGSVRLSGTFYDSAGHDSLYYREFDDPATNDGVAEDLDSDQSYKLFGSAVYGDFTATGAWSSREKEVPTGSFGTAFGDPRYATRDRQGFLDLRWERTFEHDLTALVRAFFDHYDFQGHYPYDTADPGDPPDVVLNVDDDVGQYVGAEARLTRLIAQRHRISAGLEYRGDYRQDQRNYDDDPYAEYLNDERDGSLWSPYGQADIVLPWHLRLSASLRYDHYSTFGGTTNPRIALLYEPREQTVVKLIYGRAFRAPSAYELYYGDGGATAKPNPRLDPEKLNHCQLIVEQGLTAHVRASISAFYYDIDDLISQVNDPDDGLDFFDNVDEVEAWGLEAGVNARFESGLRGRLSYSYADVEDQSTGRELTGSPQHLAKLHVIVPMWRDIVFGGATVHFVDAVETLGGGKADSYWHTSLTLLTHELPSGLEVSASLYNVLDEDIAVPAGLEHEQDTILQDGRTFRIKAIYRF